MYPSDLKYSVEHEWTRFDGDRAVIGITEFAADQLGDVVFVDITVKVGGRVAKGDTFGVVESVKTASDLYAPITGTIVAINPKLTDNPELVNQQPYGEGWMIEMSASELSEAATLLDAGAYEAQLSSD